MLELTGLDERAGDLVAELSGGNRQRVNIAIGLLGRQEVLLLDEPSAALDPRQRERVWEFVLDLAARGTTVVYSTHDLQEAARHADRVVVLADGEALFEGSSGRARRDGRARGRQPRRLRGGLRRLPPSPGSLRALMRRRADGSVPLERRTSRWSEIRRAPQPLLSLLLKDLRILRRSPGLVALLILYPVLLSVLIGFALSAGPDKPKVAFVSLVPPERGELELGDSKLDLSRYEGGCSTRSIPCRSTARASRRSSAARRRSTRWSPARRSPRW